jgi:hypothetical protein
VSPRDAGDIDAAGRGVLVEVDLVEAVLVTPTERAAMLAYTQTTSRAPGSELVEVELVTSPRPSCRRRGSRAA